MLGDLVASLVAECCRQRKEAEEEKRRVVASAETEELEIHPCSEILLAQLQREIAHRGERRVHMSERNGHI